MVSTCTNCTVHEFAFVNFWIRAPMFVVALTSFGLAGRHRGQCCPVPHAPLGTTLHPDAPEAGLGAVLPEVGVF